jgi:hypothetical protein
MVAPELPPPLPPLSPVGAGSAPEHAAAKSKLGRANERIELSGDKIIDLAGGRHLSG